jgi:outer membrane protein OmpA-like peptidoglycan-associated protein
MTDAGFSLAAKYAKEINEEVLEAVGELIYQTSLRCRIGVLALASAAVGVPSLMCRALRPARISTSEPTFGTLGAACDRLLSAREKLRTRVQARREELNSRRPRFWQSARRVVAALIAVFVIYGSASAGVKDIHGMIFGPIKPVPSRADTVEGYQTVASRLDEERQNREAEVHLIRQDVADFRAAILNVALNARPRLCSNELPVATLGFATDTRTLDISYAFTYDPDPSRTHSNSIEMAGIESAAKAVNQNRWWLVEGFASNHGKDERNASLSADRAENVRNEIFKWFAFERRLVTVLPMGETFAARKDRPEDRVVKVWDCGPVRPWSCLCGTLATQLTGGR